MWQGGGDRKVRHVRENVQVKQTRKGPGLSGETEIEKGQQDWKREEGEHGYRYICDRRSKNASVNLFCKVARASSQSFLFIGRLPDDTALSVA